MSRLVGAFDAAMLPRGRRPHVKICGLTREADAMAAAELGASAIGLVFWPRSPRAIDVDRARAIASVLPPGVLRVGVFVNTLPDVVRRTAAQVPLDVVQLHGDEPVEWADRFAQPVVKAVSSPGTDLDAWLTTPPSAVTLLVDAVDPERRGGTGRGADWVSARDLAARRAVVLAGGLSAGNVGEACALVRPYAVDVSSGVETAPGIKSRDLMAAFFDAVDAARGDASRG